MKTFFVLILTFNLCNSIYADTFTFEVAGEWKDEANWDVYPGQTIASSDTVILDADLVTNGAITMNGVLINNEGVTFETFFWIFKINGLFINNGTFYNNAELEINGQVINNDKFTHETSTIYIGFDAVFLSYGTLTIGESLSGFHTSYMLISGPFINNDDAISFNGTLDINLDPGEQFVNNGQFTMTGKVRLEGELVNNSVLLLPTFGLAEGELTLADNSKVINNGSISATNCNMSSQMQNGTILGDFTITGNLIVKASIPEILD